MLKVTYEQNNELKQLFFDFDKFPKKVINDLIEDKEVKKIHIEKL